MQLARIVIASVKVPATQGIVSESNHVLCVQNTLGVSTYLKRLV